MIGTKPYELIFKPFNKALIQIGISRSKPLCWYSYNQNDNTKNIRAISLEKIIYDSKLHAYRFCIGPLKLMVGIL